MPLIYIWIVEEHHPEHVFRQFGMKQAPLDFVETLVDLHKISLQGKIEKDWMQEHAVYIGRWAHKGEHLASVPTLDGDTMYLVAYMELYRRYTKRYITRESVYWDILVRQQFDASCLD